MIEYPVTIHKNQISEVAKLKGCVNVSDLHIDGIDYGPGTLRLIGFAGICVGEQRYGGVYRLEVGAWEGDPFEFEDLPGIGISSEDSDDGVYTYTTT